MRHAPFLLDRISGEAPLAKQRSGTARFAAPLRSHPAPCHLVFGCLMLGCLMLCTATAAADEPTDDAAPHEAVTPVVQSLESMGSLPWYDPERGGVAPVDVQPRVDDSVNRSSRWLPQPAKPAGPNPAPAGSPSGGGSVSTARSIAELIGWAIVAVLMVLVVGVLVYAFLRIEGVETRSAAGETEPEELEEDFQARLENLPVEVRRPTGDLLQEADRLVAAGQIDAAIIYLFGHRLLQLDRSHMIRLARGKTNRQYLAELRGRSELQGIMRETIQVFEASYFGRYEVTAERFQEIRASQPQFEALLAQLREAA